VQHLWALSVSSSSFSPSTPLSLFGPGVLRLFLACAVVLFHSGVAGVDLGVGAVFIFFVLSGYWVSYMWANQYRKCEHSYLVFIVSRYWRLLPLFLVCNIIAAAVIFLAPYLWPYQPRQIYNPSWWLQSSLLIFTGQAYLLGPVWSLAKEMDFYLLAPLLLPYGFLSNYFGARRWTVLLFLAVPVLLGLWVFEGFKTGLHFCFFLAGVLAFALEWKPSRSLACLSLLALVGMVVVGYFSSHLNPLIYEQSHATTGPNSVSVFAAINAVIFLPFAIHSVHQVTAKSDRFIGNLAYPVYLFHWIPVSMGTFFVDLPFSVRVIEILILSIGSAWILNVMIDVPSEKARHRFGKVWGKQKPDRVVECLQEA
jgi:peptidoglycan/LPS O-acetylase OafA/YrhL